MSGSFAGLLASVKVASVALAGGLMVRLSIAGASLAGKDISNIVMSDPWVYFRSSDENYNGYFIRVDLTTNTPTVMANKYSANGVYFTNEFFKKALVSINSGQNSGLTRATTGTINSYTVTVSTNTSIGLCYTVTGTGIPANTIVTSINGTVLTLSKRLTSTISNVILTYSPFGNNVRGQFNVCLILVIIYSSLLSFTGLNFGFLIGFLTGLFSFIPYVGMLSGVTAAIAVALFQWGFDTSHISAVSLVFIFGQIVESNFLTPKLIGAKIGLHPVWLIFGLFIFGALFGFIGVLVAVPLTAICGVIIKHFALEYKKKFT